MIIKDGDLFQFAWAGVATHANAAHPRHHGCRRTHLRADGRGVRLSHSGGLLSYSIQGTVATKVGDAHTTVPLDQAPELGDQLCGMRIHGSAGGDGGNGSNP